MTNATKSCCYHKIKPSENKKETPLINHFIGRKVKSYQLDYRASENNFEVTKFFEKLHNLQLIK